MRRWYCTTQSVNTPRVTNLSRKEKNLYKESRFGYGER